MSTVFSLALIAACLIFVAWPFFRTEDGSPESVDDPVSPLEKQKREAYAAIREAEFDLRMGKLSAEDFTALEEKYRQQALGAIAALERAQASRPRGRRGGAASFCPDCGQRLPRRAKYCGGCGRALSSLVA